jgi:hypothetical protein
VIYVFKFVDGEPQFYFKAVRTRKIRLMGKEIYIFIIFFVNNSLTAYGIQLTGRKAVSHEL